MESQSSQVATQELQKSGVVKKDVQSESMLLSFTFIHMSVMILSHFNDSYVQEMDINR